MKSSLSLLLKSLRNKCNNCDTTRQSTFVSCCSALKLNCLMSIVWDFCTYVTLYYLLTVHFQIRESLHDFTGCTERIARRKTSLYTTQNSHKLATMCSELIGLINGSSNCSSRCVFRSHPVTIDCQYIRLCWGRMRLSAVHLSSSSIASLISTLSLSFSVQVASFLIFLVITTNVTCLIALLADSLTSERIGRSALTDCATRHKVQKSD